MNRLLSKFRGLRAQLILFVLVAVLPGFFLALYNYNERRRHVVEETERDALRLVRLASRTQASLVEQTHQLLAVLSKLPVVRGGDPTLSSDLFAELMGQHPIYANIGAADPSGLIYASGLRTDAPVDASDRIWFRRVMVTRDFASGGFQIGRITKKATINFGYPVVNEASEVRAVLFAALDLSWLGHTLGEAALPEGSVLNLIDDTGKLLVHYPDGNESIGQTVQEWPLAKAILAERVEGTARFAGLDGVPRLYAIAPLEGSGAQAAFVSLGIPEGVALAGVKQLLIRNVVCLALVGCLTLGIAWRGTGIVVRPVRRLLAGTRRIVAGDFNVCLGATPGPSEIRELADSFDEMAGALRSYVSQRDSSEIALRESKEKLEYIFDHTNDGLLLLDPHLQVIRINETASRLLAWPVPGQSAPGGFVRHLRESFEILYSGNFATDILSSNLRFDLERLETETTRPLILSVESSTVTTPSGGLTCVVFLVRDVTTTRKEQFRKDSFLSVVSHKLRTPLTIIHQNLCILSQGLLGQLTEEQRAIVDETFTTSSEFKETVDKLVGFAELTSQHLDVPREEIELHAHLPSFVDAAMGMTMARGATVDIDLPDHQLSVRINSAHLMLVLENLLENAIKFNDSEDIRVRIAARKVGGVVEFSVSDNGRGIPSEEVEEILKDFYQVEKWSTGNVRGFGLGLAIVKRIVLAHGGEVRIDSRAGEGTTLTFALPAAREAASLQDVPEQENRSESSFVA